MSIVVVANLVLDPPEVYLLPGSLIPIQLSQIRQGRAEIIGLPSSQYYLEIDDANVGSVVDTSGSVQVLISIHLRYQTRGKHPNNRSEIDSVNVNSSLKKDQNQLKFIKKGSKSIKIK